ncbi:MAG: CDP-alcohol phosphatidyltransferase family protein [Methanoregulaceae archaeon]
MTLDQYRPHVKRYFDPLVSVSIRLGLTPNFYTLAAFLAAGAAGLAFYFGEEILGILLVAANAFCDALDGAIAREMKIESPRGDFLDHAVDRYADIFIITGLFAGGITSWQVGVFALTGVLMASYLGTQAQAVGVGRYYGGILGRADRLVLIMLIGIVDVILPSGLFGIRYLGWLLVLFGILGHFTALQRFAYVWRKIE